MIEEVTTVMTIEKTKETRRATARNGISPPIALVRKERQIGTARKAVTAYSGNWIYRSDV
jgi:hypothetical protein